MEAVSVNYLTEERKAGEGKVVGTMTIFNLIPTEPDEYKVYADWLEDQGEILTAAIRKAQLPVFVTKSVGVAERCSGDSMGSGTGLGVGYGYGLGSGGGPLNVKKKSSCGCLTGAGGLRLRRGFGGEGEGLCST